MTRTELVNACKTNKMMLLRRQRQRGQIRGQNLLRL
ncbi:hypothetical protein OESDEN_17332 [Oesophagostomum dentatum]|uniref:Uncharacterized protein n=1 Tax=Oesophagostomum dentatum TaxID=61180 RepID=A0A0B1SCD5_OESDE|nr:hypothetical protein OESDEN_17332 [Oesophagostomum dentatum]